MDFSTLEVTRTDIDETSGNLWNVVMWNDDVTDMGVVTGILMTVFQKELNTAVELMLTAHIHGRVVVDSMPKSLAKAKQSEAIGLAKSIGCNEFTITVEEG